MASIFKPPTSAPSKPPPICGVSCRPKRNREKKSGRGHCTLHGSFISDAEVCWTTHFPSPRPSPQGEGGSSPIGRRIACPGNVRGSGGASPSPRGEGRGEGERIVRHTSAFEMKDPCKVQRGQPHSKTLRDASAL